MTREEAIERYDRIRYNLLNREDKAAVDVAFDALREQEGLENSYAQLQASFDQIYESNMAMGKALREQPRWISVEERLPEPHKLVLVYRPLMAKKVLVTSRHVLNGCEDWSNSGYDIKRNPCITHWMPLPELPEVEV